MQQAAGAPSRRRLCARWSYRRRGVAKLGLLTTISGAVGLVATALVVGPWPARATGPALEEPRPAAVPEHDAVARGVARILAGSEAVLGIHGGESCRRFEVSLWLEDTDRDGVVDADEFVLLSHSPLMRTLELYTAPDEAPTLVYEPGTPECNEWWRDRPGIGRRVLGNRITSFDVVSDAQRLRIELAWSTDLVDLADRATVFAEATVRSED